MNKMGIIGSRDSILGFKALGLSVFPVKSQEEADRTLRQLVRQDFASVFITEDYADSAQIRELEREIELYPSIVIIPDFRGGRGMGMEKVRRLVEKAVGIDLLSSGRGS